MSTSVGASINAPVGSRSNIASTSLSRLLRSAMSIAGVATLSTTSLLLLLLLLLLTLAALVVVRSNASSNGNRLSAARRAVNDSALAVASSRPMIALAFVEPTISARERHVRSCTRSVCYLLPKEE